MFIEQIEIPGEESISITKAGSPDQLFLLGISLFIVYSFCSYFLQQ